jgi:hypothetical protein
MPSPTQAGLHPRAVGCRHDGVFVSRAGADLHRRTFATLRANRVRMKPTIPSCRVHDEQNHQTEMLRTPVGDGLQPERNPASAMVPTTEWPWLWRGHFCDADDGADQHETARGQRDRAEHGQVIEQLGKSR